jgi:hypothetical protein
MVMVVVINPDFDAACRCEQSSLSFSRPASVVKEDPKKRQSGTFRDSTRNCHNATFLLSDF